VGISHAQNFFLKGTISSNGTPVSNVHIYSSKYKFYCVSDADGYYLLEMQNNTADSLFVSHIGFYKKVCAIPVKAQKDTVMFNIELKPLVYQLSEVTISSKKIPGAKSIIERVKKDIPDNYALVTNKILNLSVLESYLNVKNKDRLLEYSGEVFVNLSAKGSRGYKYDVLRDIIDPDFFHYHIEISPELFAYYIPIKAHPVIRKTKNFTFHLNTIIVFDGQEAYKVSFNLDRKYGGQRGYLLISVSDYAVLKVYYEYKSCEKLIAGKYKSTGILYTDLISSSASVTYVKNSEGKYVFKSGEINGLYKMHTKKKQTLLYSMNCTFSMYDNNDSGFNSKKLVPLKALFHKSE
jgi:hypothetical protein